MRYNININQLKALEHGLSLEQAALMDLFYQLPSNTEGVKVISVDEIKMELPCLRLNAETARRYARVLLDRGLLASVGFEFCVVDMRSTFAVELTLAGHNWNRIDHEFINLGTPEATKCP